jgi:Ran GTPase-activating protein (RanGAP) involved in mRNA processing and transport
MRSAIPGQRVWQECSGSAQRWLTSISATIDWSSRGREFCRSAGEGAALAHLNLSGNDMGADRAESLAGVLGQCAALAHLDLSWNDIDDAGTENLAGVLTQCRTALAHLDLCENSIGPDGAESLRECWRSAQRWLTSISAVI